MVINSAAGPVWRQPTRRDQRHVAQLVEAEARAKEERDQAGVILTAARVRHQEAVRKARRAVEGMQD